MSDKVQKIKKGIETTLETFENVIATPYVNGQIKAYKDLLAFIDSLPEEHTGGGTIKENYNERYNRIAQTEQFKKSYCDKSLGKEEPASEDLEEEMIRWHKEHFGNKRDWEKTSGEYLTRKSQLDIASHFAEWQKQQMMKDAVDGEVAYQIGSSVLAPTDIRYKVVSDRVYIPNIKLGDKVKIIIVKNEQQ